MLDFTRDASRFPLLGISRLHSQNNSMLSSNRIQRDGILIGPCPQGLFSIFCVMQKFATSMMQVLVGPRLLRVSRNCRATPRPLSSCSLFPKLKNHYFVLIKSNIFLTVPQRGTIMLWRTKRKINRVVHLESTQIHEFTTRTSSPRFPPRTPGALAQQCRPS
jgi:hypothetical protein